MLADQYVVPAPATAIAAPSGQPGGVYYERLAPGGGHLPAEYVPAGQMPGMSGMPMGMAANAMHYHPQASTSGYMPMPPHPTGGYAPMPSHPTGGYAPMPSMMQPYPTGYPQNSSQQQQQQLHQHSIRTGNEWPPRHAGDVVHGAMEANGKVPYNLPKPYANELGFPKLDETKQLYTKPTFKRAEVEGDVIEIEATGPDRWELEMSDEAWDQPVLAVVDSGHKKATFRLDNAESRTMKVRVCPVSTDGKKKAWTDWVNIVKKPDGRKYIDGVFKDPPPPAEGPAAS